MKKQRKILITSALPYANGDLHIGNMTEHLITDMWTRFQKMNGHTCLAICADDAHGAPIMVEARRLGITPEALIGKAQKKHIQDLADFDVVYDNYSSTHTEKNRILSEKIYHALQAKDLIEIREIKQTYCQTDAMFLPDRFVKGTCPKCKAVNQYGDSCDICGGVYNTIDLVEPKCTICSNTPIQKTSKHHFMKLSLFKDYLKDWVPEHTNKAVANKLREWIDEDKLQDWCLSRDKPYFGFKVPDSDDKYFYVWFDAPIGYISSTWEWCERNNRDLNEFWADDETEIYHNIGKDIIYFHCLFWPAMLKGSPFKSPKEIFVHGMLTVNGEKLSKSKGTFINGETYLKFLKKEYLRYYFAAKLGDTVADLDLSWDDFTSRVNSDLVGKITNLASRAAQMLQKRLESRLGKLDAEGLALVQAAQGKSKLIASYFEKRQFSKAILEIRTLAEEANVYFDRYVPWKLIDTDPEQTRVVLTATLNVFRIISIYLQPVIPSFVSKVRELFHDPEYVWGSVQTLVQDSTLAPFVHLIDRVDPKKIAELTQETIRLQESKKSTPAAAPKAEQAESSNAIAAEISIDEFFKVDMRVALIKAAQPVEKADKLLQLTLDMGELGTRNVFAGIRSAYQAEDLVGRLVVAVANLAPRKMKFGTSEAMVLAAGPGSKDIWLLSPDSGAKPGMRIG